MKLILTHEVSGLGTAGDVVSVKDGYARNYLIPRSLAVAWTKGGESQVNDIKQAREAKAIKSLDEAKTIAEQLRNKPVELTVKAGESGRLFGAVTSKDVVSAVAESGGPTLDKRTVELKQGIKTVGTYPVSVRLHPEVQAQLSLVVKASK